MKLGLTFLFFLFSLGSFSQKASDYLCQDSTVLLYYTIHTGDTITLQFIKSFEFNGDTICYYERKLLNSERSSIVYYAYNKDVLYEGSYLVSLPFRGVNEMDLCVKIVAEGEVSDTSYVEFFDMSETAFNQQTQLYKKHVDNEERVFENVIEVDQHNLTDDFHYITIFAPGIGIISKGGNEMEFIKMEKLN